MVYAEDAENFEKQAVAAALVASTYRNAEAVISTQVMNEFYNVALKKLKLNPGFALSRLRFFAKFQVVTTSPQLVIDAAELHQRHQLSFWDALILQAAIFSRCDTLYSEDFNSGHTIGGVRVINPFANPLN